MWLVLALPAANAVEPSPSYPWQERLWQRAANLQVDEALASLPDRRKAATDAERRQIDYTRAVLLLNVQPKLQGNIAESRSLLESVRQSRADDATGLSALYYLARIAQFHTDPVDPVRAAALYKELITRAPDFPLAQEAVARWAALRLYDSASPDERRQRLAECEAAAGRLTSAEARRDLHFVLAEACLSLTDDRESVLRHLVAAKEAGIVRRQLLADTTVRIALLARELGHREAAMASYQEFLAAFPRDPRAYLFTEQLHALEAEAPPATPTPAPVSSPSPPAVDATPTPAPVSSPSPPAVDATPTPAPSSAPYSAPSESPAVSSPPTP